MATDTIIKQDPRPRRLGGVLMLLLGLPLTLFTAWILLTIEPDFFDFYILIPGLFFLILGFWAIFSDAHKKVRLRITDQAIVLPQQKGASIPLAELKRVRLTRPLLAKVHRLTFEASGAEFNFDLTHLNISGRDIVSLISKRLENQGAYLEEGAGEITGAPNGIWEVRQGTPFA